MDGDTREATSLSTPTGAGRRAGPSFHFGAPGHPGHLLTHSSIFSRAAFCQQGFQSAHLTPLSSAHMNARGSPELSVLLSPPHGSRAETEAPGQGTTEGRSALS